MCERPLATVYVEESRLEDLRAPVRTGSAEVHKRHPAGVTYYRSGVGSGLLIVGYDLRDRSLEEFATMVAEAQAALANAPR